MHNNDRTSQQKTFAYVGENLFVGSGEANYEEAVQSWYNEVGDYTYITNQCSSVCGHYKQVANQNTFIWYLANSHCCSFKKKKTTTTSFCVAGGVGYLYRLGLWCIQVS